MSRIMSPGICVAADGLLCRPSMQFRGSIQTSPASFPAQGFHAIVGVSRWAPCRLGLGKIQASSRSQGYHTLTRPHSPCFPAEHVRRRRVAKAS